MENEEMIQQTQLLNEALDFALQGAILFNILAHDGKEVKDYSDEELIKAINLQVNITMEECLEFFDNVEKNLEEELDGIIDAVFYTGRYLEFLVEEFNSRNLQEADALLLRRLQHTRALVQHIERTVFFDVDVVVEANKRIAENNNSKFTKDSEEFAEWRDGNMIRKSVEYKGEYYYLLVDKNGKVKKHLDFKSVSLGDLINE